MYCATLALGLGGTLWPAEAEAPFEAGFNGPSEGEAVDDAEVEGAEAAVGDVKGVVEREGEALLSSGSKNVSLQSVPPMSSPKNQRNPKVSDAPRRRSAGYANSRTCERVPKPPPRLAGAAVEVVAAAAAVAGVALFCCAWLAVESETVRDGEALAEAFKEAGKAEASAELWVLRAADAEEEAEAASEAEDIDD
jgi:hypothetical protein